MKNKYLDWDTHILLSEMQSMRAVYDKYNAMKEAVKEQVKLADENCYTSFGHAVLIRQAAKNNKDKQIDYLLDKLSDDDRFDYIDELNNGTFAGEEIIVVRIELAKDIFEEVE